MTYRVHRLPLLAFSLVFAASLLLAAGGFGKAPVKAKKAHAPAKKATAAAKKSHAVAKTAPIPLAETAPAAPKPPDAAPAPTPAPDPGAQTATLVPAGKGVYDANGCARCHAGGRAPDLSHEGARHTAADLASYVKNPQQWDPGSRMPAFGSRISDKDLQALGAYLASLK